MIDQDEIEKTIKNLQNINLIEIKEEKIALNAFMMNFV